MSENTTYIQLLNIVQENTVDSWSVCSAVWSYILEKEEIERERYFHCFLSDIDLYDIDFDIDPERTLKDKKETYKGIDNLEKHIVGTLVRSNLPEEDFYRGIWEKINDPILFSTESTQIAFLLSLWNDSRIPYFQLEKGCSMDNEEYRAISKTISPKIKKARFILCTSIEQKTQRASLLMKVADSIVDERERTVFWAKVLSYTIFPPNINEIVEKLKDLMARQGAIADDGDEDEAE